MLIFREKKTRVNAYMTVSKLQP